ncbi:MAG: response regulator [Candidatus Melainabacteria bacterium]|nr:response regulator [Candidatus Melainabacteria bacterium]
MQATPDLLESKSRKMFRVVGLQSIILSVLVVVFGAFSYAGVAFGVGSDPVDNLAPTTGLFFVVLGLTTAFITCFSVSDKTEQQILASVASGIALVALLILGKQVADYSFDLDSIVWGQTLPPVTEFSPFRTSPTTAGCVAMLGIALSLLTSDRDRSIRFGQLVLCLPLLISIFVMLGFSFQAHLYVSVEQMPMTLPTARVLFMMCLAACLCRPDRGYAWLIASDTAGSAMLRRLLPLSMFGPMAISFLCVYGEHSGWYSADVSCALMSAAISGLFSASLLLSSSSVRQLDHLRASLKDRVEQLTRDHQEQLRKLAEINHDLENLSEQTKRGRDQALEASSMKSEFVSKMSNEIRTPMIGVLGIVEAMLRLDLPKRIREYVLVIRDAGRSFLLIINDILDFSSLEEGTLVIQNKPFDLVQLVEGVGELLAPQAHKKGLLFLTYIDPAIPESVVGDEVRLRQVLLNLAGNAIKFTEKGRVTIRVNVAGGSDREVQMRFSVEDTGIGMTEDERRRLFQPFVQADGSINRKYGGTGLGLSISKKLVEMMGGEVDVHAVKDKGSTFWMILNLARVRKPDALRTKPRHGTRALVVVRDHHSREFLASYLDYFGFVVVAMNSLTALEQHFAEPDEEDAGASWIGFVDAHYLSNAEDREDSARILRQMSSKIGFVLVTEYEGTMDNTIRKLGFKSTLRCPIRRSEFLACLDSATGRSAPSLGLTDSSGRQLEATDGSMSLTGMHESTGSSQTPARGLGLVVDDNSINRHVAVVLLEGLGIRCHTASNGLQAIREYNARKYDVIFMDCQMPEMDGYQATKQIRLLEKRTGAHIPIVALTAHALEGSREACLAAGMDDYISKPVSAEALKSVLARWAPHTQDSSAEEGK